MKNAILSIILFGSGVYSYAQNSNQLIGNWDLKKISYKKISASNDGEQEQFINVITVGLYNRLEDEQQLDVYELELLNEKADELLKLFYQSTLEFQVNSAFGTHSEMMEQPTSGEYLLDGKKLFVEWETGDETTHHMPAGSRSKIKI